MGQNALGVVTGLAVLITGVIAVASLIGIADAPPLENLAPPVTTVAAPLPATATPVERLPGVGPATTRVLQWSGNAGSAEEKDMAQLPPSVANVLIEHGAPLLVPTASGRLQ